MVVHLASQQKKEKKSARAAKKSKNESRKLVPRGLAVKRKSKVSTTLTSSLKVSVPFNLSNFLVTPNSKCRLRLLRQERVKDYILME